MTSTNNDNSKKSSSFSSSLNSTCNLLSNTCLQSSMLIHLTTNARKNSLIFFFKNPNKKLKHIIPTTQKDSFTINVQVKAHSKMRWEQIAKVFQKIRTQNSNNTSATNCNYCPSPMHNKACDENEMQKLQQKSKQKYERKVQEQITNVRRNQKFGQVKMCSSLQSQNLQNYLSWEYSKCECECKKWFALVLKPTLSQP